MDGLPTLRNKKGKEKIQGCCNSQIGNNIIVCGY